MALKTYLFVLLKLTMLLCLLMPPEVTRAMTADFSGYQAAEGRFFTEEPQYEGQKDAPEYSGVLAPELSLRAQTPSLQLKVFPFVRFDSMDDERTHFDMREAYLRYTSDSLELLIGINKVFWGVAESNHLVDIINQTDMLENVDQEDKLGQPMVMMATQRSWGEIQLYLMPWFRERSFPGKKGRLRTPLVVSDNAHYESGAAEHHLDMALRYAHYIREWDFGFYYFYGTGREPVLQPNLQGTELVPLYEVIQQGGLDIQLTHNAWLLKYETIFRQGQGRSFAAMVGGFEYTFYQLFESTADLGILLEYNWDGREEGKAPPTFFDNDLFTGVRLVLNDPRDTQILAGTIVDVYDGSILWSVEAQRRIGASMVAELTAGFFSNIDAGAPEKAFEADDFISISLQYHF